MRFLARVRASEPALVACALVAGLVCAALFLLQGRVGVNLQDEAFLWYGAIRTHAGELPLRDFRAYDPGRYFWCAGWMTVFGDGLVAVRAAGWAFASLGVAAGLLVVSRATRGIAWVAVAGIVLAVWMSPPWKLYESSLAMLVAWIAVRLVEKPTSGRRFAAGIAVGLAAFFGRNLGVYAGLGLLAATCFTVWKLRQPLVRSLVELAVGTLAGYAPMLALVAFAHGYREAFFDSIAFYARQGALNAELPFPFPWRADLAGRTVPGALRELAVGTLFLLVPIAYAAALVRGASARAAPDHEPSTFARWAPIVALACVGAAWFHHASVRSDLPHLAQSIHPFLLAVLSLPAVVPSARVRVARLAAWSTLALATTFAVGTTLPAVRRALAPEPYARVAVGRDELALAPSDANLVRGLLSAVEAHVRPDEELWVSAQFLGLYPMLGRRAPTWDIYPAWQADEREQDRMLRELAGVRWAILDLRPIGGDARMRLEVSHPRVWRWLVESFDRLPLPGAPDAIVLLKRKG